MSPAVDEISANAEVFCDFLDGLSSGVEIKNLVLEILGITFLRFHGISFHLLSSWSKKLPHFICLPISQLLTEKTKIRASWVASMRSSESTAVVLLEVLPKTPNFGENMESQTRA